MKYKVMGYEHTAGTSRKTGSRYDMHILHVVSERPMSNRDSIGYAVDKIVIGADTGILTQIPTPGEVWEIGYNRQGRVEDAYCVSRSDGQ